MSTYRLYLPVSAEDSAHEINFQHSSSSSLNVGMVEATIDSDDAMTSGHITENNGIPADSEYDSSSRYDVSSSMDIDVDSTHSPSVMDLQWESSKEATSGDGSSEVVSYCEIVSQ
jgi:hypothetical protein